ncbi:MULTISPECIES: isocitrate lyase/phosphoenolpyruvate mutase family protein [Burkholderia]|uniref:isocitrate lyase/phosphoenolpyruvate mutase family protein n=1 Tax=Burkholderia TaxID=32008 RepID=UPI001F05D5BD|nr:MULTISPECIES: isocitrate lyase/phosphoenolpyruvate mutase family protein [Burkholderia]
MTFSQRHQQAEPLLLPNVRDAASARAAEAAGYTAIGTSSAAIADSLGYADGEGTGTYLPDVDRAREETIARGRRKQHPLPNSSASFLFRRTRFGRFGHVLSLHVLPLDPGIRRARESGKRFLEANHLGAVSQTSPSRRHRRRVCWSPARLRASVVSARRHRSPFSIQGMRG